MMTQPLNDRVPITNPDGTPTQYFIRQLQERGITVDDKVSVEEAIALINEALGDHSVNAGTGLSGGGTLLSDPTLSLNAVLNDLNDVDTTTTPPTDGQALVYNAISGLWLPGTVSGGGGGGGSWELAASVPITSSVSSVPVTGLSGAEDIIVIARSVTASSSGRRAIQVSTDNGATYYTSNGDYPYAQVDGVEAGVAPYTSLAVMHETNSTGARTSYAYIPGAGATGSPKVIMPFAGEVKYLFTASPDPINAVRVINSAGGNLTGGNVYVYKRTSGGGGGGGGMTLIQEQVVSVAAANISFTGIPATHKDLILVAEARGTASATSVDGRLRFNGDTGNNYDWQRENRFGQGSGFGVSFLEIGGFPAASSPAGYSSSSCLEINGYSKNAFNRHVSGNNSLIQSAVSNAQILHQDINAWWRSTATVDQIDVFLSSGNFDVGSVISLYGRG